MKNGQRIRTIAKSRFLTLATLTLTLAVFAAQAQENGKTEPEAAKAKSDASPATVTGSGTPGYIAIWKTSTGLADSGFYQTTSGAGLGTQTPAAKLDVETSSTTVAPAIQGESHATSTTAYGVLGIVNSSATASGTQAAGVAGTSNGTAGNTAGVLGTDYNTAGTGVFGQAVATTSSGQRGVEGIAYGPGGIGVRGDATGNTSNVSSGVLGVVGGPIDIGVEAITTSTTGQTIGVAAYNSSSSGAGGLFSASSTSGSTTGVIAYDASATGTAGTFDNTAGGNVLVGQNNGKNVFRVDGTGKGYFDGGTVTGGADFAESVAVRGDRGQYEAGDLLAIDPAGNRRLVLSQDAYSTRVAGIYSTKPGILATKHSTDDGRLAAEVPLAVMGIVPCKVSAENGAIAVGDLLVASSRAGYAMKGTDRGRMLGAVVGKAMEPLAAGSGVVEVLVTLQ